MLLARLGPWLPVAATKEPLASRQQRRTAGKKVDAVRQYKYRAVISLDHAACNAPSWRYPSGTHSVMIRCSKMAAPAQRRSFPAAIYRPDDQPLAPGEAHVVMTIEIADDEASAFLGPGQHITLWNGRDIGHGVISRRVFFTSVP